jgi:hypothetical protein
MHGAMLEMHNSQLLFVRSPFARSVDGVAFTR